MMEQKPKLKCERCYREITVAESLKHKCPKLLDLLQTPLIPEFLKEEKERKEEIIRKKRKKKKERKEKLQRIYINERKEEDKKREQEKNDKE